MKILVIGSGAREHALIHAISKSPLVKRIYAAPGNAGMEQMAEIVAIAVDDMERLLQFALENTIDLTVVGPEQPLVMGIVDRFRAKQLAIIGPTAAAAKLEGSKGYAKQFMDKYRIPTAPYQRFSAIDQALAYIQTCDYPVVIKADGLAAGKGVIIAPDYQTAKQTLDEMMTQKRFGDAGEQIVVEQYLTGTELSMICFIDQQTIRPMESAKDYKKAYDNDTGPNTGGMGAYSPSDILDQKLAELIQNQIIQPFRKGVRQEKMDYRGIIYFGLMVNPERDQVQVIEFNCRLGDPETQVILPRLKTDIVKIFQAIVANQLDLIDIQWDNRSSVGVVLADQNYPIGPVTERVIDGLERIDQAMAYHGGTKKKEQQIVSCGGRILTVIGLGEDLAQARTEAYQQLKKIQFTGIRYRQDIGKQ